MNIIINPNLVSIDGLSGLLKVGSVRMFGNPKLCYIGTETPSAQYWQVCFMCVFIFETVYVHLFSIMQFSGRYTYIFELINSSKQNVHVLCVIIALMVI